MHISSLPGEYGIGTMGQHAYSFVDNLADSGLSYWQILPIGPTSYGDSPYQSFSTFAGNPYFIDFNILNEQGYLKEEDYKDINWGECETSVDYGLLYINRHKVFEKLYSNFVKKIPDDYNDFCDKNAFWLEDYSLFMAIKDEHDGKSFDLWEEDIRRREKNALIKWEAKCRERKEYYKMLQYFFYKQWYNLKSYANQKGVSIIGDIPIYVSSDSADVWAAPSLFMLDKNLKPVEVAGCPPDAFSADGQLWGNPVYNWDYLESTSYDWWCRRIENSLKIYDVLRIDHFRGFDSFYCIPYGDKTARNGQWRKGPGVSLFNEVKKRYGELPIIAEDLGYLTDSVKKLLSDVGFPGMKLLQFAFDSREASDYLPFKYSRNSVVYTGTHDNDTILGWTETAIREDVEQAKRYLGASSGDEVRINMMKCAMESVSNTCILTMQDLIGLGSSARMNKPSTLGTNWQWRARENQVTKEVFTEVKEWVKLYGRLR